MTVDISFKYDIDALLNHKDGELGAFHVGYFNSSSDDHRQAMEELVRRVTEPLSKKSYLKILDLGCGFGYPARQAEEYLKKDITGIDFSKKSIELASSIHNSTIQEGSLHFLEMSAYDLHFEGDSFDGIFAIESLFHMDKARALKEANRVLKHGGTISVCDYYAKEGWHGFHEEGFSAMLPLNDLIKVFADSGFKNIKVHDWTENIKPSYKHLKNRKMVRQVQKDWDEFCERAGTNSGYVHITAEK